MEIGLKLPKAFHETKVAPQMIYFFKELKGVEYAYVKKFIPGKSAKEVLK